MMGAYIMQVSVLISHEKLGDIPDNSIGTVSNQPMILAKCYLEHKVSS